MNEKLRAKCDLLSDNRNAVKKGFFWENDLMRVAAATVYTGADKQADIPKMKECRKILRKKQGIFSDFRSYSELMIVTKLALAEDPEAYLGEVQNIYKVIKKGKLFSSESMVMAAMSIVDSDSKDRAEEIAEKTKEILAQLKKDHPFLTDNSDTSFIALLALTNKSVDQIVDEVNQGYELLKGKFPFHSNAVHSLSQILAINPGSVETKCDKVVEIYNAMKASGIKYGKEYELASLGTLVNLSVSTDELISEIKEASDYLKTKKGFGNFTMGKQLRHMFAALLAAGIYAPDEGSRNTSVISGSVAAVIAEQIAVMITLTLIMSSSASHSSSN